MKLQIMNDYKVELRFPRSTDPDPNLVVVAGKNEDAVFDCIDHLRAMEEDYLQVYHYIHFIYFYHFLIFHFF